MIYSAAQQQECWINLLTYLLNYAAGSRACVNGEETEVRLHSGRLLTWLLSAAYPTDRGSTSDYDELMFVVYTVTVIGASRWQHRTPRDSVRFVD